MSERWLTFDCYGTLVDWRTGMMRALDPVVPASAVPGLLNAYHRAELAVEGAPRWLPYTEVLTTGLRMAADAEDVSLPAADADVLVRGWADMPVFDDVAPALTVLRNRGWRLAIITNCDDHLFEATRARLPGVFDHVVSAESIRSYRPDLGHFRRFQELTGATAGNWAHVGASWIHDVLPAARMGIRSVWVDRDVTGYPAELATARTGDLVNLAEVVAGLGVPEAAGSARNAAMEENDAHDRG
jgi:2-haloacid dehalogenase